MAKGFQQRRLAQSRNPPTTEFGMSTVIDLTPTKPPDNILPHQSPLKPLSSRLRRSFQAQPSWTGKEKRFSKHDFESDLRGDSMRFDIVLRFRRSIFGCGLLTRRIRSRTSWEGGGWWGWILLARDGEE